MDVWYQSSMHVSCQRHKIIIIVNKIVQNCNLVDKKCVNIHVDKGMAKNSKYKLLSQQSKG